MKQLSQLAREVVSVIIGILVALFINNWNEDRKDKEYLNKIFSSIEKELEESVVDIERIIPKQLESVDSIQKYLNNEKFSIYDLITKSNGIHAPSIKTNSWNAIANSKIELIAYEKLSSLSDIQEKKENLRMRLERQMDFLLQNIEKTDNVKKEMLIMTIRDIVNAEKELQVDIEDLLKNKNVINTD